MALVIKDRVKETTTTTGTGTFNLAGAVSGFEGFIQVGDGNTTYYVCTDNTDFEIGIGTFTDASPDTLSRDTILQSSNSDNKVDWSAGTRTIFCTYPADKAVFEDASNNINGTFVGNITGNVTGNTSGTAATVTGAAQTNITSLGTLTALTVDNVAINATTIGHTDDTDLITLADGVVTVAGEISVTTLDIGGTNVTSTAAELNVLDGIASIDTDISSVSGSDDTLASAKAIKTYVDAQVTAQDLDVTSDSGTIAIDLDSETLTIAGGTGLASSASSNTITLAVDAAQTGITSLLATDIKIGEDDQTKIDFETADTINFYAGNEKQLILTDGALTPGTNAIVDLGTDALEFKDAYFDGTVEADAITIGGTALSEVISDTTGAMFSSNTETGITVTYQDADNTIDVAIDAAQTAITSVVNTSLEIGRDADNRIKFGTDNQIIFEVSGGDNVIFKASGEIEATSLDISGDADIDGTLEADAITVNGTALNTVIAGVTVANATLAATTTVTNSTANTNFPVVFHDESNALLDDTGALRYNPSTGELLVPKLTVAGTTTTVDTVTMNAQNAIIFEGATADANETTLTIIDPTSDHTINLPNASGTIPVLAAASTTAITSTPDELNVLDGITAVVGELNALDIGSTAVGTAVASKAVILDSNKDYTGIRNFTITGELDAATLDISGDVDVDGTLETDALSINGTAVTSTAAELNILDGVTSTAAELNALDGITAVVGELNALDLGSTAVGTAIASKAMILDSNKDYTGVRNFTLSGELDAGSLDISGDADIDGTLEADAITVGGTALNTVIAGVTVTNATTAAVATTVTISDNESTNEENAVVFTAGGDVDGGNIGLESDGDLTYNPSTGTVSATVFKGNIDAVDGDFDGTLEADAITVAGTALATVIAGTTVTDATNSAHVLVTDNESTNEENLITFVEGATSSTGNVGLEMDGNLTYNPSTGRLTATQLAGTLQTAAQANVTSLGTLTTLTVDNVIINGSTIGHTGDTDLMTVASGVLTVAGEVDATSLDISGDADIDGTLEADAITVNGTALNTVIADEATALAIALG
jgi:cytoskeletal protein CcmA (bactofilin family)